MVAEPEDLVLKPLRSMRGDLTDVKSTLVKMEHRPNGAHEGMITGLGLAANANIRHDTVQKQLDELTARIARLEEKV